MAENPYAQFRNRELILRDHLAIDRTILANERTALAYVRTALALAAVGGSCIKFFDSIFMEVLGVFFLLSAGACMAVGVWRYRRIKQYLRPAIEWRTEGSEPPLESHPPDENRQDSIQS